ncbi:MAG: hypothetical protein ACM3JH_12630 [Acidithiobacillales bacterium]
MKTDAKQHLGPDEIVGIVFPREDGPSEVPAHLAACGSCQAKVARLREAWLLDRNAVVSAVEALPEPFWKAQRAAILEAIGGAPGTRSFAESGIRPFPSPARKQRLFRHPAVAIGSLAAAVALVAFLTVRHVGAPSPSPATPAVAATPSVLAAPPSDRADDELLLSIDRVLGEEPVYASLVPEGTT